MTTALDELLVLTYGAIESSNVERWALEFGAPDAPPIAGTLRRSAYETDVVGNIHRSGQRYWLERNEAAVWERPFPTGERGRPPAVDIALFSAVHARETRLEFGLYSTPGTAPTKTKLRDDAAGLFDHLDTVEASYDTIENYIVLWYETRSSSSTGRPTAARRRTLRDKFVSHAEKVSDDATGYSVDLLKCLAGPLFTPNDEHHWVMIALFKLVA